MHSASTSFNAASASQVRLMDAYLGGLKEEQQGDPSHEREENSGETDDSESEPWYYRPASQNNEACGKPFAGGSAEFVSSEFQKSQSNEGATMKHYLAISPDHVPCMNDVYDMVRKSLRKTSRRSFERFGCEYGYMGIFMNVTLRAAMT